MSPWFVFMVAALAVFRVTELLVLDKITKGIRESKRLNTWTYTLITCYFCCSIWVALLAAFYVYYLGYTDLRHLFGYWMGLSGAAVVIYRSVRERT